MERDMSVRWVHIAYSLITVAGGKCQRTLAKYQNL